MAISDMTRRRRRLFQYELLIVRDICLTGLVAPCGHTMYVDKPLAGHNLMQVMARVREHQTSNIKHRSEEVRLESEP